MTKAPSSITAVRCDQPDGGDLLDHDYLAAADSHEQTTELRAELDEVQPVISAAVLAATAFRLRDQNGLISAMRLLVRATRGLEVRRGCA
jgi:hypothetical protein